MSQIPYSVCEFPSKILKAFTNSSIPATFTTYLNLFDLITLIISYGGPGSSVGIATELPGWAVRDRIPVGTRFSARPDRSWGPTQTPVKWVTGSFSGVKCGRSVLLTTHSLLVLRSSKIRAITLSTLWATPDL